MGQVGDLIGAQGTTATGVLGPAEHPGLEEGAIDDQLLAALEQIEQAYLALGSVELVLLVHGQPRHPAAFGGQRVTGVGQVLLLHEELLARSLPTPAATRSGVCSSRDAPSRVPCLSSCLLPSVSSSSFRLSLDMTDIWRLHIHNDGGSNETGVTSVAGFVNLQPRPILSKKL